MADLCLSKKDAKTLQKWMYDLPHEMVVEVDIKQLSPDKVLLEFKEVISYTDSNNGCTPTHVDIRPLMLHTHPKHCYKHQGIKFAWPSGVDLISILDNKLRYHFVASLEGIYIIDCKPSSHKKWQELSDKERKSLIRKHDIPGDLYNVNYFIDKINSLGWLNVHLVPNHKVI